MKNLRNIIAITLISLSFMSATYPDTTVTNSEDLLRGRIAELMDQPEVSIEDQVSVRVAFRINDLGEIVVLDIDTDHTALKMHVNSRLNYKKCNVEDYKLGLTYYLDLVFE